MPSYNERGGSHLDLASQGLPRRRALASPGAPPEAEAYGHKDDGNRGTDTNTQRERRRVDSCSRTVSATHMAAGAAAHAQLGDLARVRSFRPRKDPRKRRQLDVGATLVGARAALLLQPLECREQGG